MGFIAYFSRKPLLPHNDPLFVKQSRRTLTAAWILYVFSLVIFTFQAIGCIYPATRWSYIAEYQKLQFAFFGMCNTQGDVKCTTSILKASYQVAAQIEAPEAYVIDALRLQNDISFASEGLALFGGFIGIIWFTVYDAESNIELYYQFWMSLSWWTAVILAFNAAWSGTFSARALRHSQTLANKEISQGVAYMVFYWVIFVSLVIAALAAIQWSADYSQEWTLAQRSKWKETYMGLIKPRDQIEMKIINRTQKEEDEINKKEEDEINKKEKK